MPSTLSMSYGYPKGSSLAIQCLIGILVDPLNIEAVMSWERSKLVFDICRFLGLAGYYRRLVEDFSKLDALMTKLTQKGVKF